MTIKNTLYCATDFTNRLSNMKLNRYQTDELKRAVCKINNNDHDFQTMIQQYISDKNYCELHDDMIFFYPLAFDLQLVFSYHPDNHRVVLFDIINVNNKTG